MVKKKGIGRVFIVAHCDALAGLSAPVECRDPIHDPSVLRRCVIFHWKPQLLVFEHITHTPLFFFFLNQLEQIFQQARRVLGILLTTVSF